MVNYPIRLDGVVFFRDGWRVLYRVSGVVILVLFVTADAGCAHNPSRGAKQFNTASEHREGHTYVDQAGGAKQFNTASEHLSDLAARYEMVLRLTIGAYHDSARTLEQRAAVEQVVQPRMEALAPFKVAVRLLEVNRPEDAIRGFDEALSHNPHLELGYYGRAIAYCNSGDYDKARKDVAEAQQRGVQIHPTLLRKLGVGSEPPIRNAVDDLQKDIARTAQPPANPTALTSPTTPLSEMKTAPVFAFDTVEGKSVSNNQLATHQATVLNFVAPNCQFSKKQISRMEKIRQEYAERGVRFVNVSETLGKTFTAEEVVATMKELGSGFELAYDPENKIGGLFKVTVYPKMIVLGKSGNVEATNVGNLADLEPRLKQQLDALISGKGESLTTP